MELGQLIRGETTPDPGLRRIFSPPGTAVGGERGSVLSTFKGFGKNGWGKEQFLKTAERFNLISEQQHAAALGGGLAEAGTGAGAVGETLATATPAGFAAGTAGAASAVASDNPIYGGLYAQMLMRRHGFQVPAMRPQALPEAAAGVADGVVEAAAPVVAEAPKAETPIAAAAADEAAKVAALEQRFIEGFQRLGQLPAEQRIPTLAKAVDAGAAAGLGEDAFGVLAQTLADRPLEHSVDALHSSIDDALKAVPKVAEVVEKAAPVVEKAAPVVEHAAPVIEHAAPVVEKAAPIVEQVVKAAPALEEVAHAATAVVKPQVIEGSLPIAGDVLRNGLKGVMGLEAGIDDTLRLLARVHV
jgi:hypothetical protein